MAGSRNHRSVTRRLLLELVRPALWGETPDCRLFSDCSPDWDEIGRLAMDQTVGALALTSALSLPSALMPPEEWRRKARSFIERNRRTHLLVDSCVAEAVESLRKARIHAVLLKGQAYARVYPASELRQCGDIDIYVGPTGYPRAYKTAKDLGWTEVEKFRPYAKHCGFSLHGVRIELHRVAALVAPESVNRQFQEWSRRQLSATTLNLSIAGGIATVPDPLFDVVFVFQHLYHHFLNGGIGLRHLCDWAMLLHTRHPEIDTSELYKLLKAFQLLRGWESFAPILVDRLGLPEEECPFYSGVNSKRSERILSIIMEEGNFGRAAGQPSRSKESYTAWKIHSFIRLTRRVLKILPADPHTITRSYLSSIYKGLVRVINDTIEGEK